MSDITDSHEIADPTPEKPSAETPTPAQLEEPSTENEPGEEPVAPASDQPAEPDPDARTTSTDAEPSHHAVGIGIIDSEERPGQSAE